MFYDCSACSMDHRTSSVDHRTFFKDHRTCSMDHKACSIVNKTFSMVHKTSFRAWKRPNASDKAEGGLGRLSLGGGSRGAATTPGRKDQNIELLKANFYSYTA